MKVKISIDSVVLQGLGRQEAAGFARGLEHELSRIIKENGIVAISSMNMQHIGITGFECGAKPYLAGVQVAHSIYRRLVRK
jgi:hypothetical protein